MFACRVCQMHYEQATSLNCQLYLEQWIMLYCVFWRAISWLSASNCSAHAVTRFQPRPPCQQLRFCPVIGCVVLFFHLLFVIVHLYMCSNVRRLLLLCGVLQRSVKCLGFYIPVFTSCENGLVVSSLLSFPLIGMSVAGNVYNFPLSAFTQDVMTVWTNKPRWILSVFLKTFLTRKMTTLVFLLNMNNLCGRRLVVFYLI